LRDYRNWQTDPFASPDGYFNAYYGNPWWQIDQTRLDERSTDLIATGTLNFKPWDWLGLMYRASFVRMITITNLHRLVILLLTGQ